MNVPLAMWSQIVEHCGLIRSRTVFQISILGRLRNRFVGRQILSKCDVTLMIQIELLTPGQCPPWHKPLVVIGERRICSAIADQPGPDRAVQQSARLRLQILVADSRVSALNGQVGQRQADLLLNELISPVSEFAVGLGRKQQYYVRSLLGTLQRRIPLAIPL